MSTDKLLNAITEYLERGRILTDSQANGGNRKQAQDELQAAAQVLESELQAYADERSRPGMVKSILVGVDDSKPARWAVDEAVRLAERLEAKVSLVHVTDVAPALALQVAFADAMSRPTLLQDGRNLLRELADRIPPEWLGDQIVVEGNAAKQIVSTAQEIGADLLVIGTHGRNLIGRFLLGSVADAVVRHSTCPVLTVGHARDGAAPEPYSLEPSAAVNG